MSNLSCVHLSVKLDNDQQGVDAPYPWESVLVHSLCDGVVHLSESSGLLPTLSYFSIFLLVVRYVVLNVEKWTGLQTKSRAGTDVMVCTCPCCVWDRVRTAVSLFRTRRHDCDLPLG